MIRNSPIYHCQSCGAVVRQEAFRVPPFCCGHEMVKAAEETLRDDFVHELDLEPPGFNKPRIAPRWEPHSVEHVSV